MWIWVVQISTNCFSAIPMISATNKTNNKLVEGLGGAVIGLMEIHQHLKNGRTSSIVKGVRI